MVTTMQIPLCKPISTCSGLSQWQRTLSPAAKEFYAVLKSYGFGVFHSADVRIRRSAGAYLGRYLATTAVYTDSEGIRLRVAEGSRGWHDRPKSWYAYTAGPYVHSNNETVAPRCGCLPSPRANPLEAAACRRRNLNYWKERISRKRFGWYHVEGFLQVRRRYRNWCSRTRPGEAERELASAHYKLLWKRISRWFHGSAAALEAAFNAYRSTSLSFQ